MSLSATQIGVLAENLVANELMIESEGRLSVFQPVADDDGIDVLIYDKVTGKATPVQIKSRTKAIKKRGTNTQGNTVHFELRKATMNLERDAYLLCVLLDENLRTVERAWVLPMLIIPTIAADRDNKYVIRVSKSLNTNDKYKKYQCKNIATVSKNLIHIFENETDA